jgi:hypothetical protein
MNYHNKLRFSSSQAYLQNNGKNLRVKFMPFDNNNTLTLFSDAEIPIKTLTHDYFNLTPQACPQGSETDCIQYLNITAPEYCLTNLQLFFQYSLYFLFDKDPSHFPWQLVPFTENSLPEDIPCTQFKAAYSQQTYDEASKAFIFNLTQNE